MFYTQNLEEDTNKNGNFRQVLFTGPNSQLVLMSLKPGEEIGEEIHTEDQFFRFESGEGEVIVEGTSYTVKDGSAVVVPAGSKHNVKNTSTTEDLKLYTIYSPAHHPDKTVHVTKEDAMAAEESEH